MTRDPIPTDLRVWLEIPFSDQQLDAAVAPMVPGLIVAGAGTGKTAVMAARVTWLVSTGRVAADQVLGLTFTTKAAAELSTRVRKSLAKARISLGLPARDDEAGEPTISTYHSFASRLVAEHGALAGAEPTARIVSDASLHQLAYRVICRSTHAFEGVTTRPVDMVGKVLALDSALAEHDVDPESVQAHDRALLERMSAFDQQGAGKDVMAAARLRRDLVALVLELRAEKQRLMVIDFSDQLRWASAVAQRFPQVAEQMRERFGVVLLDEYQDTSVTQRLLMQSLFGAGHPLTAVGDPFQAIYGWRGASVGNIDNFPQHFPSVDVDGTLTAATVYPLTTNRRSTQPILDVANAIAAPLLARHLESSPLVAAAPSAPAPTADIVCALLTTEVEEVEWVADQVCHQHERGHAFSDITVLLRAMTRVALLRDALVRRGIPVEIVGVEGLLSLPEVVEVISVLQVLHDPTANPSMVRILAGPRWRIGPRDLALLGRRAAELAGRGRAPEHLAVDDTLDHAVAGGDPVDLVSLVDALDELGPTPVSAEARSRLVRVADELRGLRRHVGEPLGDLVQRVIDTIGLQAELMAAGDPVSEQRRAALASFLSLAGEFRDLDSRATLGGFLRHIADARRFDQDPDADLPNATDSVRIMSVHKSKGLEFPVVVLPSLDDRTFPSNRGQSHWPKSAHVLPFDVRREPAPESLSGFPSSPTPRGIEYEQFREAARELDLLEETRLAYVAVTRAETTLIASASYWPASGRGLKQPGLFLQQIKECCETGLGAVAVWAEPPTDDVNPLAERVSVQWPPPIRADILQARRAGAAEVSSRRGSGRSLPELLPEFLPDEVDDDQRAIIADWDRDLEVLLAAAERDLALDREVPLPTVLSATAVQTLVSDPDGFARRLVRPMPQQPSPAARRGTRFHAWVEAQFGQQPLLGPDELPGAADADIDSDTEFEQMQEQFLSMPYASMRPLALEVPCAILLAGRLVPGRIDAVFSHPDPSGDSSLDRWEVVDWKTGRQPAADPLQLAVYRLAWAELVGVPIERVDASFVYVRLGEVRRYGNAPGALPLPDRHEIERLITG